MQDTAYHVLLEGRAVGPFDRTTIVGMRIKKTLTSDHVLISTEGAELTVGELIGRRASRPSSPGRGGGFSVVQATFSASLLERQRGGLAIPAFKGEIQVRVQGDVLRLAGRFRQGLRWKEGRVKCVLNDVVHARVQGSQVELWLRTGQKSRLQRLSLELFTPESAGEFTDWLPAATPLPAAPALAAGSVAPRLVARFPAIARHGPLWRAALGLGLVLALALMVLRLG